MQATALVYGLMRRVVIVVIAVLAGTACTMTALSAASASPMPDMGEMHSTPTIEGGDDAASLAAVAAGPAGRVAVVTPVVVTFAGVEKVLTVKDGKVVEKRVSVGRREGDRLEIVSGLAAGEQVIAEPGNLVEGTLVRVAGGKVPAGNRTE